jgi:predicted enzyme related to lactoylglutathione lyase
MDDHGQDPKKLFNSNLEGTTMIGSLIINIDVPDLSAGVLFYERGLGFRLRRLLFDKTVAELDSAGGRIFLLHKSAGTNAVPDTSIVRSYSNHWTPVHLDIAVPDLDAAVERVSVAGATASGCVTEQAFGRLAPMRDPFGHGLCLIEFNAVGYDAVVSE